MFTKIAILVFIVAAVWFGFRYLDQRQRMNDGKRKVGERTFSERLRKATRNKSQEPSPEADGIEETEKCPTCGSFVSVVGIQNCGKTNCPY